MNTTARKTGHYARPILAIEDLRVEFRGNDRSVFAVNGVSIDVSAGETLGIVGESGSGKSTVCLAATCLLPKNNAVITANRIDIDGENILGYSERRMRRIRGLKIGMIFQDPLSSLNPVLSIGEQIVEVLRAHKKVPTREASETVEELLHAVGLPDPARVMKRFPHELSGGMRQRVVIAIALALKPQLIIADEPTTALDPTIQAQVLDLLRELIAGSDSALIIISHDFGVVAEVAERTLVMYGGRVVESGPTESLLRDPHHPYTAALLDCLPTGSSRGIELPSIDGDPPDLSTTSDVCAFLPRCGAAHSDCAATPCALSVPFDDVTKKVACHYPHNCESNHA